MKRLLFILLILASPCLAQESEPVFLERDALMDLVHEGDVEGLEALFAQTHRRVSSGELRPNHLRALNTWLIVSDPEVLAVTYDWLDAMPESIYAKVVVSFQISQLSWGIRGERTAINTYPEALTRFNYLREEAFRLAYEAFTAAPGYVPASDAVIMLNGTMQVFWSEEIDAIIADTMALEPNFVTVRRAAYMHLPQWGGEGTSGVERLCITYVPQIPAEEWLTVDTCIALLIWINSFDEPSRMAAARVLSKIEAPELEYEIYNAIIAADHIERMDEIGAFLEREGPKFTKDAELAQRYVRWVFDTRGTPMGWLEMDIIKQAGETASTYLAYDPFNDTLLQAVERASNLSGRARPADELERDKLDLTARRVAAQPYNAQRWFDLGTQVLIAKGFQESQPYMANAIAYGLQRAEISTGYVNQMGQYLGNLDIQLERTEITEAEHQDVTTTVICEAKRVARLNEHLCEYDQRHYKQECDPYSDSYSLVSYLDEIGEDFMQMAKRSSLSCEQSTNATLEQTVYQPVTVDTSQFVIPDRTFGTE